MLGSLSNAEVEMLRISTTRRRNHPRLAEQQQEVFGKIREGRFVMFVIKGEISPSNLRIAEVLKKEEGFVEVQHYVDRTVKPYGNAELTPGLMRVVPEWHEKATTGQVNLRRQLGSLEEEAWRTLLAVLRRARLKS